MLLEDEIVAPFRSKNPPTTATNIYANVQQVMSDQEGQFCDLAALFKDARFAKAPFVCEPGTTMYRNFQRIERLRRTGGSRVLSAEDLKTQGEMETHGKRRARGL